MDSRRRGILAAVVTALTGGCTGRNDGATSTETGTATAPPPSETGTPTQSSPSDGPPQCDPEDVARPAVTTGGNLEGRAYPTKPTDLTDQSVLEYLGEFETAFAWNRVLTTTDGTVTSLNVDTLDGFVPDETGDGYLASSGMAVSTTTEDGTTNEREYVANYFVSPGPVYRTESDGDTADPRAQGETVLVQCGTDMQTPSPESPTATATPGPGGSNALRYTIRNDDDRSHSLAFTVETREGTVVHTQTDTEFDPGEQIQGTFAPVDVEDGAYPVTIGIGNISETIGWKPTECEQFDLSISITPDGDIDIDRQRCIK